MKYPTRILFLISLFTCNLIFSQENIYASALISNELTKNANAVIRNSTTEITIEAIDKMVVYEKKVVTVLNELGNEYVRIVKGYNNDTKLTKLSAKIYDALGREIKKYSKRKFSDVSAIRGETLYSDARVKYVTYTPVAYPYTVVFESEYKNSSTGFIPRWFPTEGYYVGIEKSQYKLNNPLKIIVRTKKKNFKNYPIQDKSSEFNLHYIFENQRAIKPEAHAIPSRDFMPNLMVASNDFSLKGVKGYVSNWKEFGKWQNDYLISGRDILEPATVTKIKDLVKDVDNPIEKAKLVYEFVQNKTRYINVSIGIGGWQPIAANQVDKVGYGDCKGLTNYTKALLAAVGITSYYTLVYAKQKRNIDKDFETFQGNHAILNIPASELTGGNDIWLECTNQTIPFGFLGDFTDDRDVLVITPEGGIIKRTPSYKNGTNLQTTKATIRLDEKGTIQATLERVSKGLNFYNRHNYDRYPKETLIKYYKSEDWSYNNNLEVESVKLKNDKEQIVFTEDFSISIEDYATVTDAEILFRVNLFNKNSFIPKRYRNRKLPLQIPRGYKDEDESIIEIPKGYQVEALFEDKSIINKFGMYQISIDKIDEHHIKYKRTLFIKEGLYPKEDYKTYRAFRRKVAKNDNLRITLIKT
jgi:transglutaminase-like putative cysteine protease